MRIPLLLGLDLHCSRDKQHISWNAVQFSSKKKKVDLVLDLLWTRLVDHAHRSRQNLYGYVVLTIYIVRHRRGTLSSVYIIQISGPFHGVSRSIGTANFRVAGDLGLIPQYYYCRPCAILLCPGTAAMAVIAGTSFYFLKRSLALCFEK